MESNGETNLAALALAVFGNQHVLAAQFLAVSAQRQDASMRQTKPREIAVMARLDLLRVRAAFNSFQGR